jgi:hypothetical protein
VSAPRTAGSAERHSAVSSGERRPEPASAQRIALATACALAAAASALIAVVLPAEYGFDPLGSGAWLGVTALAAPPSRTVRAEPAGFARDRVEFRLGPYQSVEYKYRLESGASMLYSWQATGELASDFHGEPEGGPQGAAQSFARLKGDREHGSFTAPFTGIHGWYWENEGSGEVTIRLTTAGFYGAPREYFDGKMYPRELSDPAPTPTAAPGAASGER